MKFEITHKHRGKRARCGELRLPPLALEKSARGFEPQERIIETPAFMPVGTQATVKGVQPEELCQAGVGMILCNTYHLMKRPGDELVRDQGGLHRFMNWPGGIITDSGGFQVFSLADLRKIDDDGVTFQHHVDGEKRRLDPVSALGIQKNLGSDIAMVLDECVKWPASQEELRSGVRRTVSWAKRSKQVLAGWQQAGGTYPEVFAINQGGLDFELRRECAEALVELDFPGYALGGFSVGEPMEQTYPLVDKLAPSFPEAKPLYVMGVGRPEDLVEFSGMGCDLFDCVLPSRNGRNGQFFTSRGRVVIKNAKYARDDGPIDSECTSPICTKYSRSYLRHLFMTHEILASVLATLHNQFYFQHLMADIRAAIREDRFDAFRSEFLELQKQGGSA